MVKICDVARHSRAARKKIKAGDLLVSVNGKEIRDVLDYRFYTTECKIVLEYERDGKRRTVKIKKGEYEDIGLDFETPLMDKKHSCKNGCIFCFIDQNPKGMRESIYFKDDDSRLSFIHGNYVTLTNMTDCDVERIIEMRMSPINISIHTTDPELRVKMMKNKRAGEVLSYLERFRDAELSMAGQVVVCRGVNDGENLTRTLTDLRAYYPALESVSVVPAGLTEHREGLYPLSDFSAEEACEIIAEVSRIGDENIELFGTRLVYAADELYLKAGLPIPPADYYEGYPQLDNGVGMLRLTMSETAESLSEFSDLPRDIAAGRRVTIVTGSASFGMMSALARHVEESYEDIRVNVVLVKNDFFGHSVTVSGLLTGRDILATLKGRELGDEVLIPPTALRYPEEDFLCGMTLRELEESLGVPTHPSGEDGYSLVTDILGIRV